MANQSYGGRIILEQGYQSEVNISDLVGLGGGGGGAHGGNGRCPTGERVRVGGGEGVGVMLGVSTAVVVVATNSTPCSALRRPSPPFAVPVLAVPSAGTSWLVSLWVSSPFAALALVVASAGVGVALFLAIFVLIARHKSIGSLSKAPLLMVGWSKFNDEYSGDALLSPMIFTPKSTAQQPTSILYRSRGGNRRGLTVSQAVCTSAEAQGSSRRGFKTSWLDNRHGFTAAPYRLAPFSAIRLHLEGCFRSSVDPLSSGKISLPSHTHESRLHEWTPRVVHAQLRPEHHLRSPTATSPAPSTISYPPLRHRGAFRLPRAAAPTLRGAVRASASSAPGAAPSSASSAPGATAPLEVEVAVAHREVARELASRAEARLGPRLLPSAVPPDVAGFRSGGGAGNAVGSLDVRRGAPGSTIDFMLQSSLHCKVPNGAIDITSLLIFLNASTDAPHFLMEFIQAILMSIDCGQGGEGTLEEIVRGQLATAARALLQIWLDSCADHTSEMEEGERENMIKRDQIVRSKSIEVDLTSNLPRMFGPDVADRVIAEIQKAFGVQ
uniref:Uncharacterized protein n=1 Tax=Oryza nivara TaxID=4536 RepID=A0A0E0HTS5_ORYNI